MSILNTAEYKLYKAIIRGEMETVKQLVSQGTDIHEVTELEHWTYLHQVFKPIQKRPPAEAIQYLIDQGLDVNAIDSYGYTPLIYAVRQRNVEGMRLLLENGADKLIEHRGIDTVNALRMSFKGKPYLYDVVKLLLDFGADPDSRPEDGKSFRELANMLADVDPKIIELVSHY